MGHYFLDTQYYLHKHNETLTLLLVVGVKVRGCTAHAQYCSAGTGIFLQLRECSIILLHKLYRGCTIKAGSCSQICNETRLRETLVSYE